MKKIYCATLFLLTIVSPAKLYSQITEQDVTSLNYSLSENDSIQDINNAYTALEPQLLESINWLNNNPITKENKEIRDEKSRFVFMWMSGSPTISIQMDDRIITFQGADPAILMSYMMGWTKYSVENNYSKDPVQCSVAGITNAVDFYTKNRKVFRKNNQLDRYKEMIDNGTLVRHITDILTRK